MLLSDLHNARVRTGDGKVLGRVREVHCAKGRITALGIGPGALRRHFTGHGGGRRIAWEKVVAVKAGEVIVEGVMQTSKRSRSS
jgi:sporulation protein YlmC with PRC-barrel domain